MVDGVRHFLIWRVWLARQEDVLGARALTHTVHE